MSSSGNATYSQEAPRELATEELLAETANGLHTLQTLVRPARNAVTVGRARLRGDADDTEQTLRGLRKPRRLASLATAFLGRRAYLIRDQLFCKPPGFCTEKPYHQENAALLFDPPSDMLVT